MSHEPRESAPSSYVHRVSKAVKDGAVSRFKGMMKRVGVAGNGGSFSEQAAIKYADQKYEQGGEAGGFAVVEIVHLITAEGVLSALEKGSIDIGIFATMNNHGGVVKENLKAQGEHRWTPDTGADGGPVTVDLRVEHMLMVRQDARGAIRTIVTQPQAYEQCKKTVERWNRRRALTLGVGGYVQIQVLSYPDTATAAKKLADGTLVDDFPGLDLKTTAVIGPAMSGSRNGLRTKTKGVQDHADNRTTFAVAVPYKNAEQSGAGDSQSG